ncbi:15207_t:CDS:2, partial [Funneliformis geosporum]
AVYVEKPLIEPLTSFEPLIFTNDRIHLDKIARLFRALRLGGDNLKTYYNSLPPSVVTDVDPQRSLCGLYMIVMEYVNGQKLRDCDLEDTERKKIINDIEVAINHLHTNDIVFADLRDSNILVIKDDDEKYSGMLVDFDWAGRDNAFTVLSCGHTYHRGCIEKNYLLTQKNKCLFPGCTATVEAVIPERRFSVSSHSSTSSIVRRMSNQLQINSPVIQEEVSNQEMDVD